MKKFIIFFLTAFLILGFSLVNAEKSALKVPAVDAFSLQIAPDSHTYSIVSDTTLKFTVSVASGNVSSDATIQWYVNGSVYGSSNSFSSPSTFKPNFQVAGNYQVYAKVTDGGDEQQTSVVSVTIMENYTVSVLGANTACLGDNVTLTAELSNVEPNNLTAFSFQWKKDGNYIPGANQATYAFVATEDNSGDYVVEVSRPGCALATSHPHRLDVLPKAVVDVEPIWYLCNGTVTVTAAAFPESNGTPYQWMWVGNGDTTLTNTPSFTTSEVGTYYVKPLYHVTGCNNADSAEFEVKALEDFEMQFAHNTVNTCNGDQVELSLNVNDSSNVVYTWYENGVIIEGANTSFLRTSPLVTGADTTLYKYVVVANTTDGCFLDTDTMDVIVRPQHQIQLFGDHAICTGADVVINATFNVLTPSLDNMIWYQNGVAISNQTGTTLTVSDLAPSDEPYAFHVEYYDNATGCHSISEPFLVYVNDAIVVNVTATENTICEGGEVTLTAHLNDWNADQLTFQWYKNDVVIPGATDLTYTTSESGSYKIVVTQLTSGCTATSDAVVVEVRPEPVVTVTPDFDVICDGGQVLLNAAVEGGVGDFSYVWYRNGVQIEGANLSYLNDSPLAVDGDSTIYVYKVMAISNEGCNSNLASDTVIVRRNHRIEIFGDHDVCVGPNNITIDAYIDGVTGNSIHFDNITWYQNGAIITNSNPSRTSLIRTYPVAVNFEPYTFQVSYYDPETHCNAMSEPFVVTVHDMPVVNITASEDTICEGGEVTLVANLNDYNEDQYTFQWYKNGKSEENKILGATLPIYTTTMPVAAVDSFFVQVIQRNTTCERFAKKEITTIADPIIDTITLDVNEICEGRQVTVTATSNAGEGAVYTWYRNGDLIEGVTAASFTESPVAVDGDPTTYVYSAYVTYPTSGCQSVIVDAEPLTVLANPTVTISGDPIICANDSNNITLHANATGNELTLNYQWYENDTILTGETSDVLTLTRDYREYPYSFSVMVSNTLGCYDVSEPFLVYVNDSIVVNVTATEDTICVGGEVTMTAHLNDWNADQVIYQWSKGGEIIPGATDLTYTTTLDEVRAHTFYFTATQLTSSCTATGKATVNAVADPVIESITVSEYAICEGDQVTVTAHITSEFGVGTFTWFRNGILLEGVTGSTFVDVPAATDFDTTRYVYSAYMTNTPSGCQSLVKEAAVVDVFDAPTVTISGDPIICANDSNNITLHANATGNELTLNYQWYENDTILTGETSDVLTLTRDYREYPYSFSVMVSNTLGCYDVSEPFLVYVNDSIVVNVTATEDTICVGGEVTMTAHLNDWNADQVIYQWSKGGEIIPGATDLTYTTTLDEVRAHTFYFTATQLTSSCTATGKATVNAVADPVIDSITVSEYALCSGGEITVTAHPDSASVTGTATYTWYRNGELIEGVTAASFTESPLAVDADVTTYVYSAVLTTNVSGCESSIVESTPVTVYGNPRVDIAGDANICETDSVYLAAYVDHISDEVGILSYTWYVDGQRRDNLGYDINNPNSQFYSEYWPARYEPYRVTVEVTRENGCTTMSETFLQYVHALPVVNITAPVSQICEGGEVLLTANLDDYTTEHMTYQWYVVSENSYTVPSGPDTDTTYTEIIRTNIPGATSQTLLVAPTENTVYGVKVFQTHSECFDTDEFTVSVLPLPVVDDITLSATEVCDGGQVTISAVVSNLPDLGTPTYTWYRNGVLIDGVNGASFVESPVAVDGDITSYVYSAVVSYEVSGCQSVEYVDLDTLVVYPNPTVVIEGDPIVCQDSTVRLVANVNDAIEGVTFTYQWRRFNQDIPGATSRELTTTEDFTFGNPIEYTVVVNAQYDNFIGCRTISEPFYVVIGANPRFELTATDTMVCAGGEVEVAANIANSYVENLEVNWYVNGEYITGAHGLTYTATITENSVFTATIASNECVAVAEPITITILDLPTVASVTAYNQDGVTSVCDGGEVEVTAYMVDAEGNQYVDSTVQYQWTRNGFVLENVTGPWFRESLMSVDQDTTHITYSVVAISPITGCVSVPTQSNTVSVFRNPIVVINGSHNVCENISNNDPNVNLTVAIDGIVGYDSTTTIRWYKNGVLYETIDPYGISFSELLGVTNQSVEYQVEVIRPNGCSAWSEPFIVDVHPAPVLNITVDQNFVCQGGELTLVGNLNDYNEGNYVYQWYYTSTNVNSYDLIPGATQRTFDVPVTLQSGEYNFMLEVYQRILDGSVLGYGPSCSATDTISIDVLPQPVVDSIVVAGVGNNNSICSGGAVEVTAYVSDLPGTISYQWYRNGILIEGANSATIIDNPIANDDDVSTYIYSVIASSQYSGCQTSGDVTSDPITVYPNPRVAISGDASICEGDSVFLIAYVDNTSDSVGDLTYTWFESGQERDNMSFNLGNQPGSQFYSEYWYPRHEPYVFTVEVSRGNGCTSISEPFNVYVYERPEVDVTATETTVCEGGEVTLTANLADNTADNITYQWYTIENVERQVEREAGVFTTVVDVITTNIAGATSATYTTTVNGTTQFGVTVFQTNSECTNTDVITINTVPVPVVTGISVAGANAEGEICDGGQVTLTASIEGGVQGGEVFTWYRNGVVIPGATTATIVESPLAVDGDATSYVYNVTVAQSANGCESVLDANTAISVVVNANPTVTISGDPIVCNVEGDNVSLTANVNGNLDVTYQWFEDNAPIDGQTSSVLNMNKPYREYPYSFSVQITNEEGCSVMSEPFLVYVNDAIVVNVTATETTVCEGGEVTVAAHLNDLNADQLTFQWLLNGVAVAGATSSTFTTTLNNVGDNQFEVIVNQLTSGCQATGNVSVAVVSAPVISEVSVAGVNAGNEICEGGQVTFTAAVQGGIQGGEVFTWYRNGVVIPDATTATLVETLAAVDGDVTTYTYNVTVAQTASGCSSALDATTEVTIVVNPNPTVSVVVDGNATICDGGSVTLNANVYPVLPTTTYQWFVDNTPIAGATSASYTVDSASARESAYQYHVVVSQMSGCSVVSDVVPVSVVSDPVVNVTVDNASVCLGGSATFTATVEGGVDNINGLNGYTYAWYNNLNPNDVIGTNSTLNISATEVGTYTYWVVVTSPYGCETIARYYDFTVVPDPTVTVSIANGYPTQVCEGGSTMLTATVNGGLGTYSYQWYKNGNLLPGETNQTIHTDPLFMNAAATYTVNVVMSGVGCEATNSFVAGGIGGIVVDAPEVVISGNANTCPGGTVTLTANVTGGINGDVYQYQWYQNGQPVGTNSDVYTTSPLLLGNSYNYRVEVISTVSGCSAISNDVPANVYPEPSVAISGPNPNGISTICEAGSITLNAYVTGGVPGETYTYTWSYRQGANSGQFVTTTSSFEVPATLVANSDPNSPYYFSVSVMSDNYHCDATSSADQSYIINIISAPQATISVTNPIACEGGDITFTANVTPVGVYNYAWTIDGTTYNSNNATITLSNMAVGTHTAVVVVSSNASSAACTATATATATVVADPVVTITSDVTTLCAGGTVVLSVDQVVLDPAVSVSNYTYEWRENGVLVPNVIGTTFTQTINTPGVHTYAVRVIANNGLGCASDWSNEIQITVVEQPVVTISPVGVAMLDICEGGQIEMIANVTNSSAAQGTYTYTWYANNSNTGVTTATYAQTLNAVGAYNFYVVVNANGNSCAPATSNTLTFNVNSDPYWTNVNVFYPEICEGESVELQASVSGGVTDNAGNTVGTIVWNVTDPANNHFTVNGATNSQSVFHTPATTGTYIYQPTFVGAIGNGCDIDTNVVVPVEVFARPTASFTSGDGVVVCANDPNSFGELVVTINSNYPPFTFTVVGTDGSNNTYHTYNNTYSIYVTPSTSVTYAITFLEDAHCEAINPSSEATVIVSQIELVDDVVTTCNDAEQPMATMGVVIYSAAPGVVPTVNVIYNDPNYTAYNAYNIPIDNDGTNSSFTFPTPTVPGDYSITIEIDGCEYDAIVRVLASQYSYGETPIVNQRWDDVLVVNNNPATNGGHTYISYQWYKNGQPIEGATNQFYQEIGGVNGYYSVNLIAKDADGNIYEITTCEELFVAQSLMKVYPVPAQLNEAVTIEVNLTDEQLTGAVLDIYDAKGAVVRHLDVNSNVIVVSGFETQGSYFGRIITGNGEIKTVKFVIVK